VALSPIGAFGYVSDLPIVDMLGLTNDAIWRVEPDLVIIEKGHHRYDADWVLEQRPSLVILGNAWLEQQDGQPPTLTISGWERTLFEHPRFGAEYMPMMLDFEGTYPLVYYQRLDGPVPRGARPP
jgi:hypothetical protein